MGGYSRLTYDCMSYGLTISNHKPASMWSWALEAAEEQSVDEISEIKIELPLSQVWFTSISEMENPEFSLFQGYTKAAF